MNIKENIEKAVDTMIESSAPVSTRHIADSYGSENWLLTKENDVDSVVASKSIDIIKAENMIETAIEDNDNFMDAGFPEDFNWLTPLGNIEGMNIIAQKQNITMMYLGSGTWEPQNSSFN